MGGCTFVASTISFTHLVVEEVHSVVVQLEGQRLQEGDVVGHDLLVGEVKLVDDDGVDVVVGEQVIWGRGRWCRRERDSTKRKTLFTEFLQVSTSSI